MYRKTNTLGVKLIIVLFIALNISFLSANETELERAYAKEFAYLKAQKNMLTKRLNTIKSEQSNKLNFAKAELEELQNVVLKRNIMSEKLSDDLYRAHQNSEILTDDTALIESVIFQSQSLLKPYGFELSIDKNNYQSALKEIFSKTDAIISTLSSVTKVDGKFYADDGSEIDGTIIKIGNIARYGVSQNISSTLVAAGEGKFKVWNQLETTNTADALANNSKLNELNIFIYENTSTEIDNLKEKTVLDIINSAGIIGWVIVALGLIGLLLATFRVFFLFNASTSTNDLAKATLGELLKNGTDGALAFLKKKKGSTARVLKATIRNLDRDREHIEDIVAESILHESGRLDKFSSAIMVIAAVSPLLGLLGTVTGMIATFDIITEFGTGDPKLLSGGISIALVTTELGLIVAIPILMIGNLLSGWSENVKDNMEHSALHLINEYNKQR